MQNCAIVVYIMYLCAIVDHLTLCNKFSQTSEKLHIFLSVYFRNDLSDENNSEIVFGTIEKHKYKDIIKYAAVIEQAYWLVRMKEYVDKLMYIM